LSSDVTVTKGDVGLGNVENTALSTWAGSTNLVTLGTITTGTWNGAAVADSYVASALTGKTYNGLTLTSQSVGFTVEGGTTSKTLTVNGNATVNGTNTGDQDLSGYLLKSDNLASLANASTSRTNLGLGNLALQNGTFSGNGTFASAGYCLTLTANVTVGNNSEVWLYGGNGFGSTNTKIRRYTTTSINTGSDITYADSASNGASFTINTAGRYSITITDANSGANVQIGISKNSSQLTTSIMSITAANFVAAGPTGGAGFTGCVSVVLNLAVNDVIRPHGAGTLTNDTSSLVTFRIVYLGP
jgi:hypothetical protein